MDRGVSFYWGVSTLAEVHLGGVVGIGAELCEDFLDVFVDGNRNSGV